jgi:hypothetical protein
MTPVRELHTALAPVGEWYPNDPSTHRPGTSAVGYSNGAARAALSIAVAFMETP